MEIQNSFNFEMQVPFNDSVFSNGFLKTFQECFVFYMQREVMAEDEVKLVNVSYCRNNNYVRISNDPFNGDVVFLLLC